MKKKLVNPADLLLILFLFFLFIRPFQGEAAKTPAALRVEHARGTELLPLEPDRTIAVTGPLGTTEIEVKGGRARIAASPCEGKLCVRSGGVRPGGAPAVCLPNRVSVSVTGGKKEPDAVLR